MPFAGENTVLTCQINRLLQAHSDDGVYVDESLAPYIYNCLQRRFELTYPHHDSALESTAGFHSNIDWSNPDEDDLVELVMDNCQLDNRTRAVQCLNLITQVLMGNEHSVNLAHKSSECEDTVGTSSTSSSLSDTQQALHMSALGAALVAASIQTTSGATPSNVGAAPITEQREEGSLIPTDLLDDDEEEAVEAPTAPAPAFVSNDMHTIAVSQPNVPVEDHMQQQLAFEIEQTTQLLLSIHVDLSYEAVSAASVLAQADVNLALHAIEQALSAPPVCRHMLHDGCYRSDCHFSHEIDTHTCSFWMRGRCGKGSSCKFLHGFAECLLEGVRAPTKPADPKMSLLSQSPVLPQFMNSPAWTPSLTSAPDVPSWSSDFPALGESSIAGSSLTHGSRSMSSYAGAALRGKKVPSVSDSFPSLSATTSPSLSKNSSSKGVVKIPQDVWSQNPHHYQNASSCFQILDPIERFKEVTRRGSSREDVMDMHFQSTKTVPIVLSTILPKKLQSHSEVWVVTGTGHHVPGATHQRSGGVLEGSVVSWLEQSGYDYVKGKDRNGYGGVLLVKR